MRQMKLYSKGQVILIASAAAIVALIAGSVISGAVKLGPANRGEVNNRIVKSSKDSDKNYSIENDKIDESASKATGKINENGSLRGGENAESGRQDAKDYDSLLSHYAKNDSTAQYTACEMQNISVYDKCAPSVVNISTMVTGVNWFLEPMVQEGGTGSGSIIDARGYVVTNVHVIEGASNIYVSLSDGTQHEASVVGTDTESDIALLKFDPPQVLQTIAFGDSTALRTGQKVIAIGNPFGLERTMTTGIVSGLGRPMKNKRGRIIRNMIQTDAAINPGNSGGPLLDTAGRMVGINTMIVSSSGSSAGVGFAIPSETAKRVVSDLLKYGKVQRGIVQMSVVQLNNAIVRYAGLDTESGVLVSEVASGGNAQKAGIKGGNEAVRYGRSSFYIGGDVVIAIDDIKVASLADYFSALEDKRPGDNVRITVHSNGKDRKVNVKLSGAE